MGSWFCLATTACLHVGTCIHVVLWGFVTIDSEFFGKFRKLSPFTKNSFNDF